MTKPYLYWSRNSFIVRSYVQVSRLAAGIHTNHNSKKAQQRVFNSKNYTTLP